MPPKEDAVLDCSGLACPLPIIKTKKVIDTLTTGQVLKMIATDPGSVPDVNAWANKTGNVLLHHEQNGPSFIFYIRRTR